MAAVDLSQEEARYRELLRKRSNQDCQHFDEAVAVVRGALIEAEKLGANAGLLLHALVCTRFRTESRPGHRSEALRELTPRRRAALVGGLRACLTLGEQGLMDALERDVGCTRQRAREVYAAIEGLCLVLVTRQPVVYMPGITMLPGLESRKRRETRKRRADQPLTAAIVCLMDELKHVPKRADHVADLLCKFGLLRWKASTIDFVKKRFQRARDEAGLDAELIRWSYNAYSSRF